MTKKALREDNDRLYIEINECYDTILRISRENDELRRVNLALGEEVNFLADKINRAVDLCHVKIRQKEGIPAWLKEVMADG